MVFQYPPKLPTVEDRTLSEASSRVPTADRQRSFFTALTFSNERKQHASKIVLSCSLIVLPLVAFTVALLWIVFRNLVDQTPCPFPDLCPGSDLLNATDKQYYYVDFSATRLAFLASLSSSISFSLVGVVMSMYAYIIAKDLLSVSTSPGPSEQLPSPYQTSVLIRLLNAELLMLWEIFWRKVEEIFWNKERSENDKAKSVRQFPSMVRASVLFLLFALFASIYIQAADTYLHISTEAANFIEVQPESSASHHYSRGLSEYCLNRPTLGAGNNKNFFSCSLDHQSLDVGEMTYLSNSSIINAIDDRVSPTQDIYSFDHEDGDTYAVVGPANVDPALDWKATSFGVSTKCSAVPVGACTLHEPLQLPDSLILWPYTCNQTSAGFDFAGNITGSLTQHVYLDFHKYIGEANAFRSTSYTNWPEQTKPLVPTITDEESNQVFRNPWHWHYILKYAEDSPHSTEEYTNDPNIHRSPGLQDFYFLTCNTTVWDISYTAVGGKITSLISKTPANGTLAGIASMASSRAPNFLYPSFARTYYTANFVQTSPASFIRAWKAAVSRVIALPIGAQTSPRESDLVQRRSSKVVTKLPKSALWILVSANAAFALVGIVLAVFALRGSAARAYQVHTRLGVAGLAAALFERGHSERGAREDSKLFEENRGLGVGSRERKRVGVRLTETGGAGWVVDGGRGRDGGEEVGMMVRGR
ncbi:hypothetical protein M011DRAFT_408147 [Sporormia fimetaria CBS 119925]|uniref:Uncharacterized protein n=1 Tax=Sporormia fimetaria CBS 119925 TaxID=1340428 RepID=A0A6A6V637_9PLEO|nr:hypothetical protein M011DRAFT_408147 [Sporormia fimetaria CBS 119925]